MHLLRLHSVELFKKQVNLEYDCTGLSNLHDLLLYSPRFIDSYEKILFVIYQLLRLSRLLHTANMSLSGELKLHHVYIDEKYWVRVKPPVDKMLESYCRLKCEKDETYHRENDDDFNDEDEDDDEYKCESKVIKDVGSPIEIKQRLEEVYDSYRHLNHRDLANITKDWSMRQISNFDYLLMLNSIAGKKITQINSKYYKKTKNIFIIK